MWKFVLAIPFLFHGLAHLSGFLASWTATDAGYMDKSWIFSPGVYLQSGVGRLFGLLWLVAMAGLIGSALGIITHQEWWPILAIVSGVTSLVVIIPWWNTVPPGAKVGAVFDILMIGMLLSPLQQILFKISQ
jgi:hypothetical protein